MFVHLFAAQWLAVVEALGDELPQVTARIHAEAAQQGDGVVVVEGKPAGWRAACGILERKPETASIASLVRMMASAAETA